jgi:hypothetical protein
MENVYCAVCTESLYKSDRLSLERVNTGAQKFSVKIYTQHLVYVLDPYAFHISYYKAKKNVQKICHKGLKQKIKAYLVSGLAWLRCTVMNSDITVIHCFRFYKYVGALLEFCGLVSVHLWLCG